MIILIYKFFRQVWKGFVSIFKEIWYRTSSYYFFSSYYPQVISFILEKLKLKLNILRFRM